MAVKKKCPLCMNLIKMRNDGTYYDHAVRGHAVGMNLIAVTKTNRCFASHRTPEQAEKVFKDRVERTDLHYGTGSCES